MYGSEGEIWMKNASITFRLSEEEKDMLEKAAKEQDVPVSQLIRKAVKEYLAIMRREI